MHRASGVQQQPLPLPLNGVGSWLPSSSSAGCYKRQLMYIAAFSRMATAGQVYQFLCNRLRLIGEDVRLWHVREVGALGGGMTLLEDEQATLEELGLLDDSQLLIEVLYPVLLTMWSSFSTSLCAHLYFRHLVSKKQRP